MRRCCVDWKTGKIGGAWCVRPSIPNGAVEEQTGKSRLDRGLWLLAKSEKPSSQHRSCILTTCLNFPKSKLLPEASTGVWPATPSNLFGSVRGSSLSSHRQVSSLRRLKANESCACIARASTLCSIWRENRGQQGRHHKKRKPSPQCAARRGKPRLYSGVRSGSSISA